MLTEQEKQIVQYGIEQGKTPTEVKNALGNFRSSNGVPTQSPQPERNSVLKDVGIGALKGAGDTVMGIGRLGRYIQAGVDPFNTMEDYAQDKSKTNILSGERYENISESLKSDNKAQMTGKAIELVGEVLFPVGKVTGLFGKGATVAGASLDNVAGKIANLSDDAIEGGSKAKSKLLDIVGGLDDRTKTALERTPKEVWDDFVQKGKDAMLDDRNRTPLESVGDSVIDGLKQIRKQADSIGQAKSEIMETAKVGYQKVGNIAQQSALNIQKAVSGLKLDPSDTKLVKQFQDTLKGLGDNPQLKEVDKTIDLLQDKLYKNTRSNVLEVTDRITGLLRKELGNLNGQVKQLGGDAYGKLNDEYAQLSGIIKELNARLGKEGASAGAFVKRLFSPSDARTKELFEQLGKLTGKDYFRDSRLAKFIMDTLGDNRANSLLDEMPSTTGALRQGYNWIKDKAEIPFKAAEDLIEKASNKGGKLPQNSPNQMMGAVAGAVPGEDGEIDPLNMAIGATLGKFATTPAKQKIWKRIQEMTKELDKLNVSSAAKKATGKASEQVSHRMKSLQDGIRHLTRQLLD